MTVLPWASTSVLSCAPPAYRHRHGVKQPAPYTSPTYSLTAQPHPHSPLPHLHRHVGVLCVWWCLSAVSDISVGGNISRKVGDVICGYAGMKKGGGAPSSWEPDSMTRTSIYSSEPGIEIRMDSPGRRVRISMAISFCLNGVATVPAEQASICQPILKVV